MAQYSTRRFHSHSTHCAMVSVPGGRETPSLWRNGDEHAEFSVSHHLHPRHGESGHRQRGTRRRQALHHEPRRSRRLRKTWYNHSQANSHFLVYPECARKNMADLARVIHDRNLLQYDFFSNANKKKAHSSQIWSIKKFFFGQTEGYLFAVLFVVKILIPDYIFWQIKKWEK